MERYELDAALAEIEGKGGGETSYVSLYIRPDSDIHKNRNWMRQEMSEAESIKSDQTRKRVQSSLEKVVNALKNYTETPDNGIVVFASPNNLWVLDELPFEVEETIYQCDSSFVTEPLRDSYDFGGTYGLIVVERGRMAIGVLDGGRIVQTHEEESQVMGKTQAGGQSQARFARLREQQEHEFYKGVREQAGVMFETYNVDGVLVGGTLSSAKDFVEGYMNHDWNHLGTYGVEYATEQGLEELVEKAGDVLDEEETRYARDVVARFLKGLRTDDVAYGEDEIDRALEYGAVSELLLSTTLDTMTIDEYKERVEKQGGEAVVIPNTFEKAQMFENVTGGVGAILRFEI